jgi:DNA polymerase-1
VFIGADWSQQEVAVAAVLSGDEHLLEVYNSGDAYLGLAKKAGVIPPEGTKQTYRRERDNFKAIQLGLAYGKGLNALSEDIYANYLDEDGKPTITREEAEDIARNIFDWHQETFTVYWDWVDENIKKARIDQVIESVDGWKYFVDDDTRDTQLKNFPIQAGGAALMRRAMIRAWASEQLDVVCSLHDAIYVNSTAENAERDAQLLVRCMDEACTDILGDWVRIRVETKAYTHDRPYWDERGAEVFGMVKRLLGERFV